MNIFERVERDIARIKESRQVEEREKEKLKNLLQGLGERAKKGNVKIILDTGRDGIKLLPEGMMQLPVNKWNEKIEDIRWANNTTLEDCIAAGEHWRKESRIAKILRLAKTNEVNLHIEI